MTVYVDNVQIPAAIQNGAVTHDSTWSHLTADTQDELHAFALCLGLKRSYFQPGKSYCGKESVAWHYDVTKGMRLKALNMGAQEITGVQMAELLESRRAGRDTPGCTLGKPCHRESCGACYRDLHMPGRLLIIGSRSWTDYDTIRRELMARYRPGLVLVSGACPQGADAMCEQVWRDLGGRVERHPADWDKYGHAAGTRRNTYMARLGPYEECLAFNQERSPGTSHCAAQAAEQGIEVSSFVPSAADYDYRAGMAWKAGQLDKASEIIRKARNLYPHSPDRERWTERESRIRAEADKRTGQAALFQAEAAS